MFQKIDKVKKYKDLYDKFIAEFKRLKKKGSTTLEERKQLIKNYCRPMDEAWVALDEGTKEKLINE